jgi:hypothetical protein
MGLNPVRCAVFCGISCATFCATFEDEKWHIDQTRRRRVKSDYWPVNTGKTSREKRPEETAKNGHFNIFKSCASAISPHRQSFIYKNL